MRHNEHCFHCGESFPATEDVCPNHECQTEDRTLPVWPWSTCREDNCQIFAFNLLSWWQLLRQCGQGIAGVALFVIGVLALSGSFQLLGAILVLDWFLSSLFLQNSRQARSDVIVQEQERRKEQRKFEKGETEDNAQNRKELKDLSDKVRGLEWKCFGNNLLNRAVTMFSIFVAFLVILSHGPGKVIEDKPDVGELTNGVKSKVEKAVSGVTKEVKEELDWTKGQIDYIYHELTENRSFAWDQFRVIEKRIKNNKVSADKVIENLKQKNIRGDELYSHLSTLGSTAKASKQKTRQSKGVEVEGTSSSFFRSIINYFSEIREDLWIVFLGIEVLLGLTLAIFIVFGAISFVLVHIYFMGDEGQDKMKMAFEKAMEKRRATAVPSTTPRSQSQPQDSGSSGSGFSSSVWHSVLGSAIAESAAVVVNRFGKR